MVDIITKKIADLKNELALQRFTEKDNQEIEELVKQYRQELIDEKKQEFEYNVEIINAKIGVLEETRKEMLDAEVEQPQVETTQTI